MKRSRIENSSPEQKSKRKRINSPREVEPNRRLMAAQAELDREQAIFVQQQMDATNRGGKSRKNNKGGKNKSRRRRTNKNK